jgi:chromosome partitioning protein
MPLGEVYSVLMNKGGVGKTSLITNLAALSAEKGHRTLLIDVDGQGNSSVAFGLVPNDFSYTVKDLFTGQLEPEGVIFQLSENLDLIPSNNDMNLLEFEILTKLDQYPQPFRLIVNAVAQLKEQYDYIFIDTPPSLGLIAGNILSVVDHLIIPFVPEAFGVQGFIQVVEALEDFEENQGIQVKICGVVGMMYDIRTTLHREMMDEVRNYCDSTGIRLFKTIIPRSIRFSSAFAYDRKPAVMVDRNNRMVNAYRSLYKEVIGE